MELVIGSINLTINHTFTRGGCKADDALYDIALGHPVLNIGGHNDAGVPWYSVWFETSLTSGMKQAPCG